MKRSLLLPFLFLLLTCAPNKPKINQEMYSTWLLIGKRRPVRASKPLKKSGNCIRNIV